MRLSEVYAKSYTSLSSVINIFPDFVNAPLKLFNLVDNVNTPPKVSYSAHITRR